MNYPMSKQYYFIVFSLILFALIMSILPLPDAMVIWRPQWVLLAVICFVLQFPSLLSMISVWMLGLFLDLLTSDVFGVHAVVFVLVFFVIRRLHRWLFGLPLWQMTIVVGALLFVSLLIQSLLHAMVGVPTDFWVLFFSIFNNLLVWMLMYLTILRFKKPYPTLF